MDYEIIINKNNKLSEKYLTEVIMPSLISIDFTRDNTVIFEAHKNYEQKIYLEAETAKAWYKLKECILKKDIVFDICSGFLSFEQQENKYQNFLERNGKELTLKRICLPEYSEHHTGLALDCDFFKDSEWGGICSDENEETKLIHDLLHEFGFILRYPKGKEDITEMQYEPWHIRYVGKDLARYLFENQLSLEEYHLNKESNLTK